MMFDGITILFQCGTEFRLRNGGTQFRLHSLRFKKRNHPY